MIVRALRAHDVVATDGSSALAHFAAGTRFDVVLCDLMMPGVTGMDIYEQVLAMDPGQANRIIFVTGGAFNIRSAEFLASTRNTILEKPFTPVKLQQVVASALAQRRAK